MTVQRAFLSDAGPMKEIIKQGAAFAAEVRCRCKPESSR